MLLTVAGEITGTATDCRSLKRRIGCETGVNQRCCSGNVTVSE